MGKRFVLLRCIARAVAKSVGNVVGFGIAGEILVRIWDHYEEELTHEERKADIQDLVQTAVADVRAAAPQIVQEAAPGAPESERQKLITYLTQVPEYTRRSLRRAEDPTGSTVPAGLAVRRAEDLLPFLPPRMPRFARGDSPPGLGDWRLEELLGVGGFGEVWKGTNPYFPQPVAFKFCLDADAARSLRNEAALLARVVQAGKHPGMVQLLDTYLSADPPFLKYEYVSGGDLAGVILRLHQRPGGPSPQGVAQILGQLAGIVAFAHKQSPAIVHRDLKPANVLTQRQASGKIAIKVTDFGIGGVAAEQDIARTRAGQAQLASLPTSVGGYSMLYASPQQMRGQPPDPRDDVYALGVIWYQMLTGDLSAGRPGGSAWKRRLEERRMAPALIDLLEKCFEEDQAERPADAGELSARLAALLQPGSEDILDVIPVAERPPGAPTVAPRDSGRSGGGKQIPVVEPVTDTVAPKGRAPGKSQTGKREALVTTVEPAGRKAPARDRKGSKAWLLVLLGLVLLAGFLLYRSRSGGPRQVAVEDPVLQARADFAEYEGQNLIGQGAEYIRGQGPTRIEAWRQAAEQGSPEGQLLLSRCLWEGAGTEKNEAESVEWLRRAADQGLALAQLHLGLSYYWNEGVSQDYSEAYRWFRLAAEQGHPGGEDGLGTCYANGHGVTKDLVEALGWYRKAAAQGHVDGLTNLGWWYLNGNEVVAKDPAEGVRLFRQAADAGYKWAQNPLGWCYYNGVGVDKDPAEGLRWFRKAAEQGLAIAQWNVGFCLYHGIGVEKDVAAAVPWYRKAAEQGYPDAERDMGWIYRHGEGLERNLDEAERWYRKWAAHGSEEAKKGLEEFLAWRKAGAPPGGVPPDARPEEPQKPPEKPPEGLFDKSPEKPPLAEPSREP